jgi:hypothetical protein
MQTQERQMQVQARPLRDRVELTQGREDEQA